MLRLHMAAKGAVILAAGLMSVCSSATAASPATQSNPVAEITALEKEMEGLYNSPEFPRNPAIIHPYLSPDFTLIDIMEPGRFQGSAAIKHADEVGATFLGKVEFRNLNVHASGDQGYVEYIQYFVGKDKAGRPFTMNLFTTDIWERKDGKWRLVHQHVTLPMDQSTLVSVMAPKSP